MNMWVTDAIMNISSEFEVYMNFRSGLMGANWTDGRTDGTF